MSKKVKFLIIMLLSIAISAVAAQAMINFPDFKVFPMIYDESMPGKLLDKLADIDRLSFVELAQHGYAHKTNETLLEVMQGYGILKYNCSLDIKYYIPPFDDLPDYPIPEKLFYIPKKTDGLYYQKERMDYGENNVDGGMTMAIHIQDPITSEWLDFITEGRTIDYLRVDDINTDIVDVDTQINKIYTMITFCGRNNCTLVMAVIPVVPRLYKSDQSYLFYNKAMIALGVLLILPIYLFYFLSYYLRRWVE